MMPKVIFIGSGGLAREITSWARLQVDIVGYSTVNAAEHGNFNLPGIAMPSDITPELAGTNLAVMAIGTPQLKRKLYESLTLKGFQFVTLIAPNTWVSPEASLGNGTIVCPMVNISPNVVTGFCTIVNFCVGIGHDTILGDFAQINPGSQVGGFVKIGAGVLVGSGATIREGVAVGDGSTIASGAVVFGRVTSNVTMMGNPAKRFRALEM